MVQLNVQVLTMLSALVVPLLVGIVTKKVASRAVKTLTNLALSAIAAGLSTAIAANGAVELRGWVVNIVLAFGTSAAAYYHVYKPHGLAEAVQNIAPNLGLGSGVKSRIDNFVEWLNSLPPEQVVEAGYEPPSQPVAAPVEDTAVEPEAPVTAIALDGAEVQAEHPGDDTGPQTVDAAPGSVS